MNLFEKTYRKAERYFLQNASVQALNVQAVTKSGDAKSNYLNKEAESLQRQTLKEWKMALLMANDQDYPDRSALQTLYENLMLDNHLGSTIESRILHSQRSDFKIVDQKGNENEELSSLFERPWFEDFIKMTINVRFEGTQLIELFETDPQTKELLEIETIPMAHFNAKKGLILKNSGDTTGWNYREGPLRHHYIQIGKPDDLGMLAKMAPVVLGKKMGWGAWLDYLDKYGVGNLFITTEHQDPKELKRLEQAASNFKANGWMVSNGNEKYEIKGSEAGNPQNFDLLIERANGEISKRILGGSGITDEKNFVGSAEIQFNLAKDRYKSDLLLLENIINQELFPRLVKLSSVYAPLENYYFEWEEKPEDKKEVAERVARLAPYFDMDVEELSQRLGITLLDQRSGDNPFGSNPAAKKKSLNNT